MLKRICALTFVFMLLFVVTIFADETAAVRITYYDNDSSKEIDHFIINNLKVGDEYNFEIDRYLYEKNFGYDYIYKSSTPDNRSGLISIDLEKPIMYEIKVFYKKERSGQMDLTINYYNSNNNKLIDTYTIRNLYEEDNYTYTIKQISGYTFDYSIPTAINDKITKTISYYSDKNIIDIYYKPNYYTADVNGYDFKRNNASATDTYYTGTKNTIESSNFYKNETGLPIKKGQEIRFAQGYNDGTFRPDNYITRGETLDMFSYIMNDKTFGYTSNFSDVPSNSPYYNSVSYFSSKGIISGYVDDTFRPDNYITREEFATIATKIYGFSTLSFNDYNYFSDIDSSRWSYPFITAGKMLNLVDGYKDGQYKPTNYITRAEATRVINSMIGGSTVPVRENIYKDVPENHWAYAFIVNCGL